MTIDEVTETLKECERELRIALSHMTALTDQPELRKAMSNAQLRAKAAIKAIEENGAANRADSH